jgi:hypothetical protein
VVEDVGFESWGLDEVDVDVEALVLRDLEESWVVRLRLAGIFIKVFLF